MGCQITSSTQYLLGGGFNFLFYNYLGRWSNLTNIFQMGWNHQLVQISFPFSEGEPGSLWKMSLNVNYLVFQKRIPLSTFWGKASDGLNFHQNQWNHFPWLHQMIDPPEVSYFNSPWKLAVGWKEDRLVVDWNLCYFYPYLGKWSILTSAIFFWVESTNDRDDPTF